MTVTRCKNCEEIIDVKAVICPKCGVKTKKQIGCFTYSIIGLLILFLAYALLLGTNKKTRNDKPANTQTKVTYPPVFEESTKPEETKVIKTYNEGETVTVGYTSYAVWGSNWRDHLSDNQFLDKKPNAKFLFVELTVRNNDKKGRVVPPFKLIDENNSEYDAHTAIGVENSFGIAVNLNPNVKKRGIIVFDAPDTHNYRLKVSGGYWSSEYALIELNPN